MSKRNKRPIRPIYSLFTLSAECASRNFIMYTDAELRYLPTSIKAVILPKLLRPNASWNYSFIYETLGPLLYPGLTSLNLSNVNVNGDTLQLLQGCTELTELSLRRGANQNISSEGLIQLFKQTTKLLAFDISYCQEFNNDALEALSFNCQNLHELSAEGCPISDDGLTSLALNNKKIQCLTVSHTNISGEGIGNAVHDKNWRHLRELRLDNCSKVTDDALRIIIENCPKIEILTFFNCEITDETTLFQEISKRCKKLKQLNWTISW